jgi:hypothetical protein
MEKSTELHSQDIGAKYLTVLEEVIGKDGIDVLSPKRFGHPFVFAKDNLTLMTGNFKPHLVVLFE